MNNNFFVNPFCNNDDYISLFACGYGLGSINKTKTVQIRNEYILHYVEKGKGYFETGGKSYAVSAGDVFAIYPGEKICYYADTKTPWTNGWINFVGKGAGELLTRTGITKASTILSVKSEKPINTLMHCLKYVNSGSYIQTRLSAYVLEFLSLIEEKNKHFDTLSKREKYVSSAISYMEYYFSDGISASDVSNYLGLERTYFYRIFKKETGVSPTDFLTKLRIGKAKQLITSGESFSEVASAVGIIDIYYFSKLFTKETGITPSAYRKAGKLY